MTIFFIDSFSVLVVVNPGVGGAEGRLWPAVVGVEAPEPAGLIPMKGDAGSPALIGEIGDA